MSRKAKKVFEGKLELYQYEDGGHAALTTFDDDSNGDMGVDVSSWTDNQIEGDKPSGGWPGVAQPQAKAFRTFAKKNHPELAQFIGRRIRITVETL